MAAGPIYVPTDEQRLYTSIHNTYILQQKSSEMERLWKNIKKPSAWKDSLGVPQLHPDGEGAGGEELRRCRTEEESPKDSGWRG